MSLTRHLALALTVGALLLATAAAQSSAAPLTLREAASIALEKNPLRKAALADTTAEQRGLSVDRHFT